MSLRDTAVNDLKTIANETLVSSALYFAIMAGGVDNLIYKPNDPMWLVALKSGTVSSAVNVVGSNFRLMWPWLNFF